MNFETVSIYDLQLLKRAIESGRLRMPCSEIQLSRWFSGEVLVALTSSLGALHKRSFSSDQILIRLEALLVERTNVGVKDSSAVELVISRPQLEGVYNRDTSVVVNDLFLNARKSVLVAGYAIHDGKKIFQFLSGI